MNSYELWASTNFDDDDWERKIETHHVKRRRVRVLFVCCCMWQGKSSMLFLPSTFWREEWQILSTTVPCHGDVIVREPWVGSNNNNNDVKLDTQRCINIDDCRATYITLPLRYITVVESSVMHTIILDYYTCTVLSGFFYGFSSHIRCVTSMHNLITCSLHHNIVL